MRIPRALVALPLSLAVAASLGGPTALADPPAPPGSKASVAGQEHRSEQAEATLDRVQDLVDGTAVSERGKGEDDRDLTLALRDLRLQMDDLGPAQKKQAERYFLRPGDGPCDPDDPDKPCDPYIPGDLPINNCSGEICVHYTETGADKAKGSDGNPSTIPTYVTQVQQTLNQINADYVAAGYRTPVRDGTKGGGNNKIDIYLGDIGNQGLYGFCTTDDPKADLPQPPSWDVWAYCALDNDYSADEFPTNSSTENMQVTAAHEFFHAVQYAYDFGEDGWIIESTATWVEDEMFDGVNDNRQYLSNGPLGAPYNPVDTFGDGFHYGTWIWWRYLTEKFPAKTGKLPKLVLDVWKKLDGAEGGPDRYSTQGLAQVLAGRNTNLKRELQLFFAANRHPKTVYEEGGAYKASPAGLKLTLTKAKPRKAGSGPIHHMASATVRFTPGRLSQTDWKLKVIVDAPPTARGGSAVVVVYKKNGKILTSIMKLNSQGNGTKNVQFNSGAIAGVDAVLVNSSARFNCWQSGDSPYSCLGIPRDDNLKFVVTGKAFRS